VDKNKIAGDVGKPEKRAMAMRFVLVIGVMSFFADFTYEGARSVYGPFLAGLAASATVVSIVTGFGELVGYGFRLVSGRWADRTGNFWPIAIFGYFVQLLAVPALALARPAIARNNRRLQSAKNCRCGRPTAPTPGESRSRLIRRIRSRCSQP
jgi:hypothetical protein